MRLKMHFEAVANGDVPIERELLLHAMLPNGATVAEYVEPAVERAYQTGVMPESLLSGLKALPERSGS